MKWLIEWIRGMFLDISDARNASPADRKEPLSPEVAQSIIRSQVETHHRIQEQSLKLLRLLVAIVAVSLTALSVAASGWDLGFGFPARNIYVQRAVNKGLIGSELAFSLVNIQLDLVFFASAAATGWLVRAIYTLLTVLSGPNLRPGIGNQDVNTRNERISNSKVDKYIKENSEELNKTRSKLNSCYRHIRAFVLIAGVSGGVILSILIGAPFIFPIILLPGAGLSLLIFAVDKFTSFDLSQSVDKWENRIILIIYFLTAIGLLILVVLESPIVTGG